MCAAKNKSSALELILSDEVQSLLDDFAALIDARVTFFGPDGTRLRRGKEMCNSEFCRHIQSCPGGLAKCMAMDAAKQKEAVDSRDVILYRCHAGAHEIVAQVHKEFGRIDILVNNAGITKDGLMMRMDENQWDSVIDTNLKSAFNFIHACTPVMARQRGGSIINMSSVVGISGNAGQCNYSASKAGLIGLAKSIAKEMGSRGIRANCIAPGFIATDMTGALSEEVRKEWEKQIPLRRGGTPEDVANVALFLASDLSAYVTGQVISCCGGMNC